MNEFYTSNRRCPITPDGAGSNQTVDNVGSERASEAYESDLIRSFIHSRRKKNNETNDNDNSNNRTLYSEKISLAVSLSPVECRVMMFSR